MKGQAELRTLKKLAYDLLRHWDILSDVLSKQHFLLISVHAIGVV